MIKPPPRSLSETTNAPNLRHPSWSDAASQSSKQSVVVQSPVDVHPASFDNILKFPIESHKRRRTNEFSPVIQQYGHVHLPPISQEIPGGYVVRDSPSSSSSTFQVPFFNYSSPTEANETRRIEAEYRKIADTEAAAIPAEPLLSPARWKRDFRWPNQYTTQQCMCLFRYYIDCLGPWVGFFTRSQLVKDANVNSSMSVTHTDSLRPLSLTGLDVVHHY